MGPLEDVTKHQNLPSLDGGDTKQTPNLNSNVIHQEEISTSSSLNRRYKKNIIYTLYHTDDNSMFLQVNLRNLISSK